MVTVYYYYYYYDDDDDDDDHDHDQSAVPTSTRRSSAVTSELLPAPVRPTMPTFSLGLISKEIPTVAAVEGGSGLIWVLKWCDRKGGEGQ